MKRVALARGATRLSRKTPLARSARQPATVTRQPRQRPQMAPGPSKAGDWSEETRAALQRRSGGWCEICGQQPATDAHHRQRRRQGDHSIRNGLLLCRTCHRGAHEHPADARGFGWIVPTWASPATTAVLINGNRWCLLEPDGTYRTDQRGWPA
jgi:HNH endonuclease